MRHSPDVVRWDPFPFTTRRSYLSCRACASSLHLSFYVWLCSLFSGCLSFCLSVPMEINHRNPVGTWPWLTTVWLLPGSGRSASVDGDAINRRRRGWLINPRKRRTHCLRRSRERWQGGSDEVWEMEGCKEGKKHGKNEMKMEGKKEETKEEWKK